MKSAQSLAVLGFAAVAQAAYPHGWNTTSSSSPVVYTTVTTDVYTTYCPVATTFTQGSKTYIATASQTLTITDCPCTYSHPLSYTPKPTPSTPASYPPVWVTTTEIVQTYTTYCPVPTTVVQGNHTYTATEATTLTITNCPCTAVNTYPGTTTTIPVGTTTTYCPVPTTITTGGSTYPVTTPGIVTIPIYSTTVVPITSHPVNHPGVPATTAPYPTASIETSGYASGTASATPSGPTHVEANGASMQQFGFGAMAAGLVALVI
ncbi:hypothetical protein ONS95_008956 [Cadophora gregata]|uniref:uncharacterized protein n=1 Tax=Cadophora gregata TaxID=51156 RepID=UPI0026DB17C1|nr:uncharacterized protein ONS95_008956 [Cadophora gregata]KAK0123968.1 hypothetical protein ONS95_008956 [Cadophora gregata]KAK0130308.1 hypothetical protein ONS96_000829 [Cadophora gregata f. sp. sojae]